MLLKPEMVVLELTNRCNLCCKHCSSESSLSATNDLKTDTWLNILDKLNAIGTRKVILSGGEPFLHKGFFEILKHACSIFECVGITSNGMCMSDSTAQKLIGCGAKEIQFSIDGLETEHDYIRGKNTYKKVLNAIETAKRAKLKVFTMTVISSLNYHVIAELIHTLSDRGVDIISFERFTPLARLYRVSG